jgi:hypothetical protein
MAEGLQQAAWSRVAGMRAGIGIGEPARHACAVGELPTFREGFWCSWGKRRMRL